MYYWNKDNFEGLIDIAEEFKSKDGYELFADYCKLREQGLKKQAVSTIRKFVEQQKSTSILNQRNVAVCIAELCFWRSDVHQLMSHPLQVFITSVLESWCSTNSPDAPYTWLGYMTGNVAHFKTALEYNPKDQVALSRLALSAIDSVDYQTHHLSESLFLGDEKTAIDSLKIANQYIEQLEESDAKARLRNELSEYEELVGAWLEFSSDKERKHKGSFPEWASENGSNVNFRTIVYYDK